jgi:uncharacterized membrane protein
MRIPAYLLTCLLALWAGRVEAWTAFNGTFHVKNNTANTVVNVVLKNDHNESWGISPNTIAAGATQSYTRNDGHNFYDHPPFSIFYNGNAYSVDSAPSVAALNGFTFNIGAAGPIDKEFTATVTNDQLVSVDAYWTFNGSTVKTKTLAPGESDSYTFEWTDQDEPVTWDYGYSIYNLSGFDVELETVQIDSGDESQDGTNLTNSIAQTYTEINSTTITTDGPINWGSETGDDVNKSGFSSLVAVNQVGDEEILKELRRIREEQELQGDQAREPTLGDATADMSAQETDANNLATQELGSFKTWTEDNAIGAGSDVGGSPLTEAITISKGNFTYTMNLSGTQESWMGQAMAALKSALAWIIALTLFAKNWRCLEQTMHAQFQVQQVGTVGQEILGTNIKLPAALIAAAVIVAALATVPTVAIAYLDITGIDGVNPLASWASGSPIFSHALYYINLMFPVGTVLTAIASHLTFRLVLLGLFAFWGSVIKAMVGL